MARRSLDQLKSYLLQLATDRLAPPPKDPDLSITYYPPPWPRVVHDRTAKQITDEIGSLAKTKRELVARLNHFSYPYQKENKTGKSFLRHVKSLGLLGLLLKPPFIWEIRMVWFVQRLTWLERDLKGKKLSEYGFPLEFHRKLTLELFDHMERITQLAERHEVPDMEWFAEYYPAIQNQLLRNGAAYYPELRRWFKPFHRLRTYNLTVDNQVDIYQKLVGEFKKRGIKNNRLACHLTALICSPADCIQTGKLDPNPELVRKNVRDWRKRQNEQQAKRRTKPSINPAKNS